MRFYASWWVLAADKRPREPIAEGLVNWWVTSTRVGVPGVEKLLVAVVDAESKDAATAIVEAHWTPTYWFRLDSKPSGWLPHTSRFPSTGHEMIVRGRR